MRCVGLSFFEVPKTLTTTTFFGADVALDNFCEEVTNADLTDILTGGESIVGDFDFESVGRKVEATTENEVGVEATLSSLFEGERGAERMPSESRFFTDVFSCEASLLKESIRQVIGDEISWERPNVISCSGLEIGWFCGLENGSLTTNEGG